MTAVEFTAIFVLGLAGSLHCLGMCGPIVLSYGVGLRGPRPTAHAAYNAGRILTYMLLGALAGTAGRAIALLGQLAGLASGARIFAGAAMIVAGVLMIGFVPSDSLVNIQRRGITKRFAHSIGKLILGPTVGNKFALGLILGFLPCGLIYAALLKALESGGAISGALTMLAFGLGTAATLFAAGLLSSIAGARLGRWSNRVAAVSIMLFGVILLWRGITAKAVCHG
ncbi:MAG TPA: sulfite exporter TauE/SafE family protein [Bryobacteraceae bacterium]|nr:sulfite exporter TauE/SafE family protein [Bryobacteraceae bacterium]